MIPDRLRERARAWGVDEGGAPVHQWIAALEAVPARGAATLLLALEAEASVRDTTPPAVAGVRRESLVRFDALSSTWAGTVIDGGGSAMVRVARSGLGPVARRVLGRELVTVAARQPSAAVREPEGAVVVPLRGWVAGTLVDELALARAAARARLATRLGEWPAELAEEELRDEGHGPVLVCLTLGDHDPIASIVARLVDASADGELGAALRAWAGSGGSGDELEGLLRDHFVRELTGRRHALALRFRDDRRRSAEGRLLAAVRRLQAAVPAPPGRGAVGVDLEGRITVVVADRRSVRFGPDGADGVVVWDEADGLRPAEVRRLLRARASAMPNPVLDARVGGDPASTEAICRWVAGGLQLRTVRLLLEHGAAGGSAR